MSRKKIGVSSSSSSRSRVSFVSYKLSEDFDSYRISNYFFYNLIFAFFTISFISQNIQYSEIISAILCYRNFSSCKKTTGTNEKVTHLRKFCDVKITRNTVYLQAYIYKLERNLLNSLPCRMMIEV